MSATEAETLELVKLVCSTDPYRRDWLRHPFTITVDGERLIAATDGKRIVAIASTSAANDLEEWNVATAIQVLGWGEPSAVARATVGALRAWAGELEPLPEPEVCEVCKGKGTRKCPECEGSGEVEEECDCGHTHEHACTYCEDGEADCGCGGEPIEQDREARPGRVCGRIVDRNLAVDLLKSIPQGIDIIEIGTAGELDPIKFRCAGWRAALMPYCDDSCDSPPELEVQS